MKFVITIYQDEDGVFIAECPAIPGCVSQGKTESEAEKNIQEAIKECLEVRAEKGMPLTVTTRQRSSHLILTKPGHIATLSVPNHPTVARGTLRSLITRAGLTIEEFLARWTR